MKFLVRRLGGADRKVREFLGGPGLAWAAAIVFAAIAIPIAFATLGPFGAGTILYTIGVVALALTISKSHGKEVLFRFLGFAAVAALLVILVGATGVLGLTDSWSGGSAVVAFLGGGGVLAAHRTHRLTANRSGT